QYPPALQRRTHPARARPADHRTTPHHDLVEGMLRAAAPGRPRWRRERQHHRHRGALSPEVRLSGEVRRLRLVWAHGTLRRLPDLGLSRITALQGIEATAYGP